MPDTPKSNLTTHVPVRFRPATINWVKVFAEQDRKTVSAWIREKVDEELARRDSDDDAAASFSHG